MTHKQVKELHIKVAAYINRHPDETYLTMSTDLGISPQMLSNIALRSGIRRRSQNAAYTGTPDLLSKLER
jgi:hypothetical protein